MCQSLQACLYVCVSFRVSERRAFVYINYIYLVMYVCEKERKMCVCVYLPSYVCVRVCMLQRVCMC